MNRRTKSPAFTESKCAPSADRVAAGHGSNTCESICEPPQRDRNGQARTRLRDLIGEGLASGQGQQRTTANKAQLLAIARGEID